MNRGGWRSASSGAGSAVVSGVGEGVGEARLGEGDSEVVLVELGSS